MLNFIRVGWLSDFTSWIVNLVREFFSSLLDFFDDIFVYFLQKIFDLVIYLLGLLSVPDFMSGHSIGGFLSDAGPTVLWFVHVFRIGDALAVISVAMVFYVFRRVLTLGIW